MTASDPSRRADATGAVFIALAAICFGTLGPLSRYAADAGVSSLTLVTWRAALGAIVVAMFEARRWSLAQLGTPKAQSDWQAWREEVRQEQSRPGPVERRVPESSEPPALVMMRDHFAVSMVGAILFSSMLYWVVAWLVMGMMKSAEYPATTKS